MLNVDFYRPIVEFLALYMGSNTEVILCDTENILLIENSMDEERFEGAPIGEMQQALIQNPECRNIPYNINYRTLSKTGEKVRSATLFIRDANGTLEGLLTVNQCVGELVRLRNMMDMLISGEQDHNVLRKSKHGSSPKQSYEALTLSVTEIIDRVLEEATIRFGAPPNRLTANEKISTIREMDSRGVFLAKGSVNEVADKLGNSKATIYRYLHQLETKQ